ISCGYTLNPLVIINSFFLPTIKKYPSSSCLAKSPVYNQPFFKESFVSFFFFQYPFITCGPFIINSPISSAGSSQPLSSTILQSVLGSGSPILPTFRLPKGGLRCVDGEDSDNPKPSAIVAPVN